MSMHPCQWSMWEEHPYSTMSLHCCCTKTITGRGLGSVAEGKSPLFLQAMALHWWEKSLWKMLHRLCGDFLHNCRAEMCCVSTHQSSYFGSWSLLLSLWQRGWQAPNLLSAFSLLKVAMHNLFHPAAVVVVLMHTILLPAELSGTGIVCEELAAGPWAPEGQKRAGLCCLHPSLLLTTVAMWSAAHSLSWWDNPWLNPLSTRWSSGLFVLCVNNPECHSFLSYALWQF